MNAMPLPLEPAAPGVVIRNRDDALRFMLAGNAYVTFRSQKTGDHFTFHVTTADPAKYPPIMGNRTPSHFVAVLVGPERYMFLGTIFGGVAYWHGSRSRIAKAAPSAKAFAWVFERLAAGRVPENVDVYHEGRCGRCARQLTTPESVTRGLGPECATKVGL